MIDEALVARLYGGTAVAPAPAAPAPSSTPSAEQASAPPTIAERLYGTKQLPTVEVPATTKALRDTDLSSPGARLYATPTPHSELVAAMEVAHTDPQLAKAHAIEWTRVAGDVGADDQQITMAVTAIRKHSMHPLSDADEAALSAQASTALDRAHGADAPRVRQAIKALLARDSRLSTQLVDSGAILEPNVFLALGQLAERERIRGRLTLK